MMMYKSPYFSHAIGLIPYFTPHYIMIELNQLSEGKTKQFRNIWN